MLHTPYKLKTWYLKFLTKLDSALFLANTSKCTYYAECNEPMNIQGVSFLRFSFGWKMHENWCCIDFHLLKKVKTDYKPWINTLLLTCSYLEQTSKYITLHLLKINYNYIGQL